MNIDSDATYHALLNSKEYKEGIKRLSSEIKRNCKNANNEATVSSLFENSLYYFLRSFFKKEIKFQKEKTLSNSIRHIFDNKRMDLVTNNLIIEYKHGSKLKSNQDIDKAIKQTKNYLKAHIDSGNDYEAVLTDGVKAKFIKTVGGEIKEGNFIEINSNVLDKIIKNMLFFDKKKLAGSNIANDFKIDSENNLSKNLAQILFDSIKNENIIEKTNMLFSEWRELFHLSEADKGKNQDIDKRRKGLGEVFGCSIKNNDLEYKALFSLQTVYAIIVKLTALKSLNQITLKGKDALFEKLISLDSQSLKLFFQQLEDGYAFKNKGIRNLLEGDFFAWYCDDNQWNDDIYLIVKEILDVLNSYEDLKFNQNYEPQDLFKDLYLGTIPKYVRHSLGEYFTPSWLADSVIDNSLNLIENKNWKGIDPCCGSGIFLVQMIKKITSKLDEDIMSESERKKVLKDILNRIKGIDLNPLSVLTARVNYFIAISKFIGNEEDIEIPVYLGDSANIPKKDFVGNVECYTYEIKTQKQIIKLELPISFVENNNFSKVMSSIQTLVKAEKPKQIVSEILEFVDKQERTKDIENKIQKLSQDLVNLHKNKWDGIWVRIISNFLSTAKMNSFDLVVGNPPWVKWEFLPQLYAEKIKELCVDRHLFSGSVRTGGISLNICALISNVSASNFLNEKGILAFLMPKTLMTQQSYEGFRNFYLDSEKKNRLYIQKIDDWSNSGHPFISVQEKFLTYFFGSKKVDYSKGFIVNNYNKKSNARIEEINTQRNFEGVKKYFEIEQNSAKQLNKNKTSFSFINKSQDNFKQIVGNNAYKSRSGAEFTPGEIYFIKAVGNSKKKGTYNFKNNPLKTAKYKVIQKDKIELDTEYIYPLVKGPNIKPFKFVQDENFAIFPYNWGDKKGVSFNELNKKSKKLAEYLIDYKNLIEQQSEKSLGLSMGNEFYSLSKIGEYTFTDALVSFRDNTNMCATVITPLKTPWGEIKMPVCAKHAPYISMTKNGRYISLDEAHYICGILNTKIVKDYISASNDSRSISIDLQIKIPEYDLKDKNFVEISNLSKDSQRLANKNEDYSKNLIKIEKLYLEICKNYN